MQKAREMTHKRAPRTSASKKGGLERAPHAIKIVQAITEQVNDTPTELTNRLRVEVQEDEQADNEGNAARTPMHHVPLIVDIFQT